MDCAEMSLTKNKSRTPRDHSQSVLKSDHQSPITESAGSQAPAHGHRLVNQSPSLSHDANSPEIQAVRHVVDFAEANRRQRLPYLVSITCRAVPLAAVGSLAQCAKTGDVSRESMPISEHS
jgi:hypothetical protein